MPLARTSGILTWNHGTGNGSCSELSMQASGKELQWPQGAAVWVGEAESWPLSYSLQRPDSSAVIPASVSWGGGRSIAPEARSSVSHGERASLVPGSPSPMGQAGTGVESLQLSREGAKEGEAA